MTIHASDPFATPEDERSAVRRLRGRLPAAVTLWTAYHRDGRRAGLTVSSTLVIDGDPGRLLGVLDEESDLWEAVAETRQFAVTPLDVGDSQLADMFAGLMPAPGGAFAQREWQHTPFGPVLATATAWAGCRLDETQPLGWGLVVQATVVEAIVASAETPAAPPAHEFVPLVHYRGRYCGAYSPRRTTR